jgi:hypothetical protein
VTTCGGSIITQMIATKMRLRPRQRSFDSAYAAGTLASTINAVELSA